MMPFASSSLAMVLWLADPVGPAAPGASAPTNVATPPAATPPAATPPAATPPAATPPAATPPAATPPTATPPTATPPAATPPAATPPAATPPAATPPAPPADAAAKTSDVAAKVGELAGRLGDGATEPTPEPVEGARSLAPERGATETAPPEEETREPAGVEWDESDDVDRPRTITRIYHVPVRPPPPPPPPPSYDDEPTGVHIGGFGGLSLRGSALNRNPSVWVGARGAIIFGRRFAIGGAFYEATARFGGPIVGSRGERLGLRAAYGGLTVDWTVWRKGITSLGIEGLVGAGAACVSKSPSYGGNDWRCIEAVRLFVFEPGMNVAFDLTDWFRVGVSLGWRFVARQAWRPPNDFSLSGPYLGLNLDFGWFGNHPRTR
jgi:hypothetical protein